MFESATLRLSGIYLGILVLVCTFFSYNWYNIATHELDRGITQTEQLLERQPMRLGGPIVRELLQAREDQLKDSKRSILARILLVNMAILGLGAAGSYMLARRTLQPIEQAHEAQIRFSADASHELRTPLTAIRTESEVALMDKKLHSETRQLLESIIEEVDAMTRLTDELLLLARQHSKPELKTLQLKKVMDRAIKNVEAKAHQKNISLKHSIKNAHIQSNADMLQHILTVLLDNAIKYSPSGSRVDITMQKSHNLTSISISDRGPGIPQQLQEKIFERFYRVDDSRSKTTAGNGLGLAIAREFSEVLGASISVKNNTDVGATFTVTIRQ